MTNLVRLFFILKIFSTKLLTVHNKRDILTV
nr:MAG TPA: hypothetical protein [Caudoviricetes sp.]